MTIFAIIFLEDGQSVEKAMLAENLSDAADEARDWRLSFEDTSTKSVSALILKDVRGWRILLGSFFEHPPE